MNLRPETQKVISAIRINGLEASTAVANSFVHVSVFDPQRGAEASFGFDATSELQAVFKLASDFLSPRQREEIFGTESALVGA